MLKGNGYIKTGKLAKLYDIGHLWSKAHNIYMKPSSQLHKHTLCLNVTTGGLTCVTTLEWAPEVRRTSSYDLKCISSDSKNSPTVIAQETDMYHQQSKTNVLHLFDKCNAIQPNSKIYLNVFWSLRFFLKTHILWMFMRLQSISTLYKKNYKKPTKEKHVHVFCVCILGVLTSHHFDISNHIFAAAVWQIHFFKY